MLAESKEGSSHAQWMWADGREEGPSSDQVLRRVVPTLLLTSRFSILRSWCSLRNIVQSPWETVPAMEECHLSGASEPRQSVPWLRHTGGVGLARVP